MTTFDSSADPRPLVGLIELPDLAELLTACGLNVVTGPDFRTAATAIREGFQSSGAFPLITADINAPGLRPWLGTISKVSTQPIAIVRGSGAPALEVEGAIDLPLPFSVDGFLQSLGMAALGGAAGSAGYPVSAARVRAAAPAPAPMPVPVPMPEPDFGDEDFVAPAPAARRAPDQFEDEPFGAPAPSRRAARAVAPETEEWDTPAPAPAPAPVEEAPSRRSRRAAEVPVQQAPAQDDWDTPAPQAVPAAPQYAQAQPDAFEAPAAPAYAQPAPVAQAPAPAAPVYQAPAQDDWDTPAPQTQRPAAPQYAAPEVFQAPAPAAPQQYRQPAAPAEAFPEDPFEAPAPQQYRQPAPAAPAYREESFEAPAPQQYRQPAAPAEAFPEDPFEVPAPQQYRQPAPAQQYAPAPVPVQAQAPAAPVYREESFEAPAPQQYRQPAPAPQYAAPEEPFGYQQAPQARQQEFFDAGAPGQSYPAPAQRPVPYAADREAAEFFTQQTAPAPRQGAPLGFGGAQQGDSSGIFDDFEASRLQGTGRSAAGLASFIISYSGKGGVGKSTASLQLAHKAAASGLKVVLIDGNSGQGDLRTYLRLNRTDLPTIYDAAIGPIKNAILTPDVINRHREPNLGEVKFAFIAAPPDDINDPDVVTHDVYRRVIEFARRNSDLVIMDTQIIESADRTGVVTQLILPALVHDAWGVGVTDMTNVGVNNLNNRLRKFLREEVPIDRLMVMINRVHPEQLEMAAKATTYFHDKATFLGSVEMDAGIGQDMNAGRINISNNELGSIMAKVLLRVTGNEFFRAEAEGAPAPSTSRAPSGRKGKPAPAAKPKPAADKPGFMDMFSRFLPGKKAA